MTTIAARVAGATPRQLAAALAVLCAAALAGGAVVQYGLGHLPCSLCVLQRLAYVVVLALAAVAMVVPLSPAGWRAIALLILAAAVAGVAVAAYQVGMNLFSQEVGRCGRGPEAWFDDTPLSSVASWLLDAGGDCGKPVRVLGPLTMPQLGLAGLLVVLALAGRLAGRALCRPK